MNVLFIFQLTLNICKTEKKMNRMSNIYRATIYRADKPLHAAMIHSHTSPSPQYVRVSRVSGSNKSDMAV